MSVQDCQLQIAYDRRHASRYIAFHRPKLAYSPVLSNSVTVGLPALGHIQH